MYEKISVCLTFSLLLVVALADQNNGHSEDHHHHLHHGQNEPHPSYDGEHVTCRKISPHNADFAFNLYKKLSSSEDAKGKNIFFSPLSISMALSMLALGAKNDTHSQIFSTLGYSSLTEDQVNEAYEHLLHMLGHSMEAMVLETGGALAVQEGFKAVDKFLKDAQHFYHGEAFSVDFSKPEVALEEVNKFIARKTKDNIKDMVKDVNPATVMLLINYIYFKGKWQKPFAAENTAKADFFVDENTKVSVDMMMLQDDTCNIYIDQANFTTFIKLPYHDNASMVIVLPDPGKMEEVEKNINMDQLRHWLRSTYKRSVELHMPKFSISASASLADTLKDMGMVDPFSDAADFTGISEGTPLKVTKVLHRAVLSVDEKGTEAAGATVIELVFRSMVRKTIIIDRPFLVFILERSTRSILFMGKITDPTAE